VQANDAILNMLPARSVKKSDALSITLEDVSKRYGDRVVLQNLSLDVQAGHMVVVVGPSGCGKTTLLRLLAGFIAPDSGRILFQEQPVQDLPPEKRPTSLVFQNYALWPHKTVFDNIAFGLRVRGWDRKRMAQRVSAMLELVGLPGLEKRYPGQLSGGQQQRVALARSLAIEPGILLLDEPLSNLDAQIRQQMRGELRAMQQRLGITAIYVTHDQEEALGMADRIIVMHDGRVEQYDAPGNVYTRPASPFVASFIARHNLLPGKIIVIGDASVVVQLTPKEEISNAQEMGISRSGATISVPRQNWMSSSSPKIDQMVTIAIKPEHIQVRNAGAGEEHRGVSDAIVGKRQSESFIGTGRQLGVATAYGLLSVLLLGAPPLALQSQPEASIALRLPAEDVLLFARMSDG